MPKAIPFNDFSLREIRAMRIALGVPMVKEQLPGSYHWVRHPYYVTAALLMASVAVLTASWLIGSCCLVVLAMLAVRTPKAEQLLIERFGREYRDYMARTGRFFPRISERRADRIL